MHSGVKVLKSKEMGFFRKDLEELIVFEKFKSVKGNKRVRQREQTETSRLFCWTGPHLCTALGMGV